VSRLPKNPRIALNNLPMAPPTPGNELYLQVLSRV
jgi:hypothetical protein